MAETQRVTHVSHFFGSATLSDCGRYRYALERRIPDVVGPNLCWLMLNPSTADATKDDPTIRKVMGFTKRNGYGVALVVNLFALRETHPKNVRAQLADAEGDRNCEAIMQAAAISDAVVCAWGAQPWAREQARTVLYWLAAHPRETPIRLLCLGKTKDGDPLHPLMPSYDGHPLVPFVPMVSNSEEPKG
jgi:hypothetical protein